MSIHEQIRDPDRHIIKIGSRVKILCDDDKQFYNKIGVVTLLEVDPDGRIDPTARAGSVFVQMSDGGGMWWHNYFVRVQPKQHRPGKGMKMKIKTYHYQKK